MINKALVNKEVYRTEDSLEKYSSYNLHPVEKYLFKKYYRKGENILDLACGAGRTTVRLHEMGYMVKGIDFSDVLINVAKKRFPYLNFRIGDYSDIKEESDSFDHVLISHNGIDYAYPEEKRIKGLNECSRVLKKSGTLILSSHNIKSLHFSPYYFLNYKRILWKLKNSIIAFKNKDYIMDLGMYTFYGSNKYIVNQVEQTGLKLVEMVGFRLSSNKYFNKFISPYIHYVFKKN